MDEFSNHGFAKLRDLWIIEQFAVLECLTVHASFEEEQQRKVRIDLARLVP